MLSVKIFKNLDKEFKETLSNFVYDKMEEKTKIESNQNSKLSDLSIFLTKRYGNKSNKKEEKYSDDIINYMMNIEPDFKNKIIKSHRINRD